VPTFESTYFAYPRRNGQAEFSRVVGYICRDGLHVCKRSPIRVLTVPGVDQHPRCNQRRYRLVKPPPTFIRDEQLQWLQIPSNNQSHGGLKSGHCAGQKIAILSQTAANFRQKRL